jgi:DNA-binding LacI/PurR family transcriptional regulator
MPKSRRAPRSVGIRDVAREAGVSVTTVSHALSGKGRIPEETRQRVREVADRLRYHPNASARSLAKGRTGVIAMAFSMPEGITKILTDIDYFNQAIRAGTERALEHDLALVIGPPTPQTGAWLRLPLDGIVIFDPVSGDPVLSKLRHQGMPMVLVGRDPDGDGTDYCVDNDHVAATGKVLDHLHERGARRIALLAAALGDAYTEDCVHAYRRWCRAHDAEPIVELPTMAVDRSGPEAVERLLARRNPPDGIYANVEKLGIATLRAAAVSGVRVPEDLLVVVSSDRRTFEDVSVLPTTLELDPARTAIVAIDLLVELIEGRPPQERLRVVPSRLVPRASTAREADVFHRRQLLTAR